MKAKFFLLGLCALGLMACSIDEVSQVNDTNAIQFKATTATRVAATTTNNLQSFTVWAWNDSNPFMDHVTATKQSNGVFSTSPYYFWPTGTVDFYALAPASVGYGVDNSTGDELAYIGGEITLNEDDMGGIHYEYTGNVATADIQEDNIVIEAYIPGDTDSQIDLCYAITKGRSSGAVPMNFRHALSQVVFKAKDVNEDFVVDIAGISVCSVNRYGKYTLKEVPSTTTQLETETDGIDKIAGTQGEWSGLDHKARFEADITPQTLATDGTVIEVTSDPLMLLPQEVEKWDVLTDASDKELGSYIAVLCHVTEHGSTLWPNANETGNTEKIDGVEYAYIAMPVDVAWEEGCRYTYTIIFGEGLGYYPPDDPNWDLEGTPVLVPITFNVTVDEFQDAEGVEVHTDTDLSTISVSSQAELEGAIRSGYQEITLTDNITLEDHNLYFYNDCVLDLGEYTLTGVDVADDEDCSNANSVIFVYGGTLTVNGPGTITTEGSGTGNSGNGSGDTSIFWLNGGNLIINGGTYNGGSWLDPDGSDYTDSSATVYVQSGFAYIYDGTFTCGVAAAFKSDGWKTKDGYTESIINIYDAARKTDPKTGWAYVYGGQFRNFDPGNNPCEGNNTNFCADGYSTVSSTDADGNTWFTVCSTTPTSYTELEALVDGGCPEITITQDMELEYELDFVSDCVLTVAPGVTITVPDYDESYVSWSTSLIHVYYGATVDIYAEGATFATVGDAGSVDIGGIWVVGGSTVNIHGGTYKGGTWNDPEGKEIIGASAACVYAQEGFVNIYDGTFMSGYSTGMEQTSVLNCYDSNYSSSANIVCYGGTYQNFDPANNKSEGDNTNFCATGYTTTSETGTDGLTWYTVVEDK